MKYPTEKIHAATRLAMKLHGGQVRKVNGEPVMCHLVGVATLVALDGGDEDDICAAMLHDSVEDAPAEITHDQIRAEFGDRVADMVRLATDTPDDYKGEEKPDWLTRKKAYIEQVAGTNDASLCRVIAADKVDNIMSIIAGIEERGVVVLDSFKVGGKKVWYFESVLGAIHRAGFHSQLTSTLELAIAKLKGLTKGTQDDE